MCKAIKALFLFLGSSGLLLSQCGIDSVIFTSSGNFVIPQGVTAINIIAIGGDGGEWDPIFGTTNPGGSGAQIEGTFLVTPGQNLEISIGYPGLSSTDVSGTFAAGGGGGTGVFNTTTGILLLVAGGGGGSSSGFDPSNDGGGALGIIGGMASGGIGGDYDGGINFGGGGGGGFGVAGGNGTNGGSGGGGGNSGLGGTGLGGGSEGGNGGNGSGGGGGAASGQGGGGGGYIGGNGGNGTSAPQPGSGGSSYIDTSALSQIITPGIIGGGLVNRGLVKICFVIPEAPPCGKEAIHFTTSGNFSVPYGVTSIRIIGRGADGGNWDPIFGTFNRGGAGARVDAEFAVSAGDDLQIIIGLAGSASTDPSGSFASGGGGGTGVYNVTTGTLMLVAGGGGGSASGFDPEHDGGGALGITGAMSAGGTGGNAFGVSNFGAGGGGGYGFIGGNGINGGSGGGAGNNGTGGNGLGSGNGGGNGGNGSGGGGGAASGQGGGGGGYIGGNGGNGSDAPAPGLGGSSFVNNSATAVTVFPGISGGGINESGYVHLCFTPGVANLIPTMGEWALIILGLILIILGALSVRNTQFNSNRQ